MLAKGYALALCVLVPAVGCGGGESADAPKKVTANLPGGGSPSAPGAAGNKTKDQGLIVAPARGPEHAVYSLYDNRLSAHSVHGGGLVVNGRTAGFAKYMRFRFKGPTWELRQQVDGENAAVIKGSTGRLNLPLTAALATGAVKVRMRVHNAAARRVGFRVNGDRKKEVTVELAAGWSVVEATVPEGAFRAGDNEVLLFTSKGKPMALAWMQVGGEAKGEPSTELASAEALLLGEGAGFAYHVIVPAKGLLSGDLVDPTCSVEVVAEPESGKSISGSLVGKGAAVNLSALAGKVVRLELTARGCAKASLSKAALVVPGEQPTFVRKTDKPKYVILWVMDSLRADRVRTFNPEAPAETPMFDKLATTSTVFMQNYVQGNESKSSHASIWSSLYPVNHRYYQKAKKHDHKAQKIDATLKKAGFFTSGVSGNGYVIPRRGFGDSWDKFRNHIHVAGSLKGQGIMDTALATVEGKTEPWFIYIGTIDTHVSWRAKQPWFAKLDPGPYSGKFVKTASGPDVGKIATGKMKISDRDIKRIRALYDSNVSYQDDLLRQLFEKLDAWGITNQTMVIITADHGDEQFEVSRRRVGHGTSLRETLVHVPLVVHFPPLFPAGKLDAGVEVVDILPTVADALGQPVDERWQGRSLVPVANGVGAGYPSMTFASQYEEAHTARVKQWKYDYGRRGTELFDLVGEPSEKTNVASKHPYALQMMSDAFWTLRTWNKDWHKSEWGNALNVSPSFAAAVDK